MMAAVSADNRGLRLATRYAVLLLVAIIFVFPLLFMMELKTARTDLDCVHAMTSVTEGFQPGPSVEKVCETYRFSQHEDNGFGRHLWHGVRDGEDCLQAVVLQDAVQKISLGSAPDMRNCDAWAA